MGHVHQRTGSGRIAWIDYAKGLSIILVVQLHSVGGLEHALGVETWAGTFAEFARSFRMPLFFLIAGLFLSRSISQNWTGYFDRKVMHFAYFYVLWLTIQFVFKVGHLGGGDPVELIRLYVTAFIEPFGTLWFIYLLAVFFIVTKLLGRVNIWMLWGGAALLCVLPIETDSLVINEFCSRYIFFVTGYLVPRLAFQWAEHSAARPMTGLFVLGGFLALNLVFVSMGWSKLPGAGLIFGMTGAFAMIGAMAILARINWGSFLRYCGERSLQIYLAFFLPMGISRMVLVKLQPMLGLDPNVIAIFITVAAVAGALIIYEICTRLGLGFLYKRPEWGHLPRGKKTAEEIAVR